MNLYIHPALQYELSKEVLSVNMDTNHMFRETMCGVLDFIAENLDILSPFSQDVVINNLHRIKDQYLFAVLTEICVANDKDKRLIFDVLSLALEGVLLATTPYVSNIHTMRRSVMLDSMPDTLVSTSTSVTDHMGIYTHTTEEQFSKYDIMKGMLAILRHTSSTWLQHIVKASLYVHFDEELSITLTEDAKADRINHLLEREDFELLEFAESLNSMFKRADYCNDGGQASGVWFDECTGEAMLRVGV